MTTEQLLAFLTDELGARGARVDADTLLFSSGVIDSFALVSLVAFVERHCAFRVDSDEMALDNWDSIAKILRFVQHRKASVQG